RGLADHPFTAVRVIARGAKWVIRDHVIYEVRGASVADLVGITRPEKKRITYRYTGGPILVPHLSRASNNHIKLPLRGVRMVRAVGCLRGDSNNSQVKGMPFSQIQ